MNLKRIEINSRGLYVVQDDPAAPKFKRLEASLGWLNPKGEDHETKHALLVGGEQEDGRYRIFLEVQGDLSEIGSAAIDVKDALMLERFWTDTTHGEIVNQLRMVEGLCIYGHMGVDDHGRVLYTTTEPRSVWPYFREDRPVAAICGVPNAVRVELDGGFDRLVRLVRSQKLIVNQACQNSHWVLAQARKTIEDHPVARALVWLAWSLENCGDTEEREAATVSNPYPNRPMW